MKRYEVEVIDEKGNTTTELFSSRKKAKWRYHNLRKCKKYLHCEVGLHDLELGETINAKLPGTTEMVIQGQCMRPR